MSYLKFYYCLIIICLSFIVHSNPEVNLDSKIEFDTAVHMGKLENGLIYYIRYNPKPEKRVDMQLIVKAGSVQEEDNQQGLAHFAEHMCFNGTKHFNKQELINSLERMGIKFGPELNAYTSFNMTAYMLTMPTDKKGLVDTGLMVLEDWAHLVSFEDSEIDKERGVITEEWRLGLGANDRMLKKWLPIALTGSRYADRLPIGKPDIIKNFEYETIKQYYKDWYRPNLMALIVVGDIDVNEIENKIKLQFSGIKNPENEKKHIIYDVPNPNNNIACVATDKEALYQSIDIYFKKYPKEPMISLKDYRNNSLIPELVYFLFNQRLKEICLNPDGPFLTAYGQWGDLFNTPSEMFIETAISKENQLKKSIETLLLEAKKAKDYGFLNTEFEREKLKLVQRYENQAKESGKTKSENYTELYLYNFMTETPIPSAEKEFEYIKSIINSISLDEINNTIKKWVSDDNIIVIVESPEKEGVITPTENEILEIVENTKKTKIEAYTEEISEKPLLEKKLVAGKIIKKKYDSKSASTELTLSNGVKVVLKPTEFKNNEILFTAQSKGGHSLYPDSNFMSARYVSSYFNNCGAGDFDKQALSKKLAGKTVSLSFNLADCYEVFNGSTIPKDFETLLQLLYLAFTKPIKDQKAFDLMMTQERNQYLHIKDNPKTIYADTIYKIISQNNLRSIIFPSENQLKTVNLDTIIKIYKERVSNAADYVFVFVGNFNVDSIAPLIEKYIGSLPASKSREKFKNVDPIFPSNTVDITIYKGIEEQSNVSVIMKDKIEIKDKNKLLLRMVMDILDIRLREVMREEKSGTYGVRAAQTVKYYPLPKYSISIRWGCSPDNVDTLTKSMFGEITTIMKNGPNDDDLNKEKSILLREMENQFKENTFWLAVLNNKYFLNSSIPTIDNSKKIVTKITKVDIQSAANKYLKPNHYVRVVLKPEKK